MSIQDDYFDLRSKLKGEDKKTLNRIWKCFCEAEKENDRLQKIASGFKVAIETLFKKRS